MKPTAQEFERLALEQLDMLYRVAFRLARNGDRASDLVQETYLRAFRSRDSFDLQAVGIRPSLIRILHNLPITPSDRARRHPIPIEHDTSDPAQAPAKPRAAF